jgi:hypothetical protein
MLNRKDLLALALQVTHPRPNRCKVVSQTLARHLSSASFAHDDTYP